MAGPINERFSFRPNLSDIASPKRRFDRIIRAKNVFNTSLQIPDMIHDIRSERLLLEAAHSFLFGPTVERYINRLADPTFREGFSGTTIKKAVTTFSELALATEKTYFSWTPERGKLKNDADFLREMDNLDTVVAETGGIHFVPEAYATTREEGRRQAMLADLALGRAPQEVQQLLAKLNYTDFSNQTMLSGSDLTQKFDDEAKRVKEWIDTTGSDDPEQQQTMPHLTLSNFAIGTIANTIRSEANKQGATVSVIDLGSGSGATLAAITRGMTEGEQIDPTKVSIAGIECTDKQFNELTQFGMIIEKKLNGEKTTDEAFSVNAINTPTDTIKLEPGTINLIHGDIVDSIEKLHLPNTGDTNITIVTANYSWHRLPTETKQKLMQEITAKNSNVVFLIGDLVQNASPINRRYFNLIGNGPLNCGNIGLNDLFEANGLTAMQLDTDTAPNSISPVLAQALGGKEERRTSDSLFTIAYTGDLAKTIVNNWK